MFMSQQNAVQMPNFMREHLLPEIGTDIDNEALIIGFDHYRSPQPFVFRIVGQTNRTLASHNRHTLRCSCS
jgi:hypothetical protein